MKITVDLRASGNYISREYILRNKTSIRDKKYVYQLRLADESSIQKRQRQIKTETVLLFLKIEEYHEEIVLNVLNIKYNIILRKI